MNVSVGARVEIWWERDRCWYPGDIIAVNGVNAVVSYEDGDVEHINLATEQVRVVSGAPSQGRPAPGPAAPPSPQPQAGPASDDGPQRKRQRAQQWGEASWGWDGQAPAAAGFTYGGASDYGGPGRGRGMGGGRGAGAGRGGAGELITPDGEAAQALVGMALGPPAPDLDALIRFDLGGSKLPAEPYTEEDAKAVFDWLEQRGLSALAPILHANEVDMITLAHLTLQDLKDMKLPAVGTRRRLLLAIDEMHVA